MEKMRYYIATVKDRFHPTLSPNAARLLDRHYQSCRENQNNTVHITVRFFESLIRLSQAHAKLMYRSVVTLMDAAAIIILMESSAMKCGGLNSSFSNDVSGLAYTEPLHIETPSHDEAQGLFLRDQSRLLLLYDMIECIPPKDRRVDSGDSNGDSLVQEQCLELYGEAGVASSQRNVSQYEDTWGRTILSANPPSQIIAQNSRDSNKRKRSVD